MLSLMHRSGNCDLIGLGDEVMRAIQKQVWCSLEKKTARSETIIDCYRKLFGAASLPRRKQYWTMCGDLSDGRGNQNQDSELNQIVRDGLINPKQFHGVELNEEIYNRSKLVHPEVNLYNNEFGKQLNQSSEQSGFNPGIVNADLIYMSKKGAKLAANILNLLHEIKTKNVMVICNIMLNNPYHFSSNSNIDDPCGFYKDLKSQPEWYFCQNHWKIHEEFYIYPGNGEDSNTIMCSHIFYNN